MPPSAWVDAACNLNGFRDGHDRLLIVNKNHTSNRIVASVKFKPGPSQPCTDGADIDFGAKKPLSPFEVVDGMSPGEFKYTPAPRPPYPNPREKNCSDADSQNKPCQRTFALLLDNYEPFFLRNRPGVD
jgi:hypothetical protein